MEKYNPDLGVNFKTYAGSRIRGAMIDEIRKLNWLPRTMWQKIQQVNNAREKLQGEYGEQVTSEMLAGALGISMSELHKLAGQTHSLAVSSLDETLGVAGGEQVRRGDLIRDPDSPDPLDVLMKKEGRAAIVQALNQISERDRTVLALYYQEGLTLKEIGRVLEVSESRVCQLHTRALERVRDKLELPAGAGAGKKTEWKGGK
ncbi:MAG: RNA polymerase sigma factor [Pelotomaculum thermopropionicum]|uniref:RNA polymerase sigma factor n=1 Tax=Pelotomaculum thermopropionicum TaxID=110500 RepID=A0A117M2M5_9FIRM|nr:MAG: RNA polymerase sigma factor [Pelotomaculum thermopropionicum]